MFIITILNIIKTPVTEIKSQVDHKMIQRAVKTKMVFLN